MIAGPPTNQPEFEFANHTPVSVFVVPLLIWVQFAPASVVRMMSPLFPTATAVFASIAKTELRTVEPTGLVCVPHVEPPLVVCRIVELPPTAQPLSASANETLVRVFDVLLVWVDQPDCACISAVDVPKSTTTTVRTTLYAIRPPKK
jgi:hypothetical protein